MVPVSYTIEEALKDIKEIGVRPEFFGRVEYILNRLVSESIVTSVLTTVRMMEEEE